MSTPEDVIRRANSVLRTALFKSFADSSDAALDVLLSERDRAVAEAERLRVRNVAMREAHIARVELLMGQRTAAREALEAVIAATDIQAGASPDANALADRMESIARDALAAVCEPAEEEKL